MVFGRLVRSSVSCRRSEICRRKYRVPRNLSYAKHRRLKEEPPLFEDKQVRPVIDTVLILEEADKAHEHLDSHHRREKIALQVGTDR